jgi:hypothetical protein
MNINKDCEIKPVDDQISAKLLSYLTTRILRYHPIRTS